ncbi:MAG: hypothetical protein GX130_02170 [Candidatus Hydrogenedens sp.]|jgi:type I restriction enzyme S subunit|nr:hypothetical protein [Candidatus Hydrogenedens sp.]
MKWNPVQIAQICLKTRIYDPRQDPDTKFIYVDISAIDRDAKVITVTSKFLGVNAPNRARKEIRKGDILVSTIRPNLNSIALVPQHLDGQIASTGFCVLRPNKTTIVGKFLFYFTTTSTFINTLSGLVRGAHYPAVSDRDVKEINLPLPSLSEQHRIVEILDQADALRKKRAEADIKAAGILPALFYQMFGDPATNPKGWDKKLFDDTFDDCTSKCPKLQRNAYQSFGKFPVIDQGKEMIAGYTNDENLLAPVRQPIIIFGDHTRVVKIVDFPFVAGADGSRIFIEKEDFSLPFLAYQLKLHSIPNLGYSRHMRVVRRLHFIAPPLDLQKKFAQNVLDTHMLQKSQAKSSSRIEDLFSTLLHRAFTGDLTSSWREAHLEELLQEMECQAKQLNSQR